MILKEVPKDPDLAAIEALLDPRPSGPFRELCEDVRLFLFTQAFEWVATHDLADVTRETDAFWSAIREQEFPLLTGELAPVGWHFRAAGRGAPLAELRELLQHVAAVGPLVEALGQERDRCDRLIRKLEALPAKARATAV